MTRRLSLLLACAVVPAAAGAAPTLDPLFSDHAVLQRGKPIAVWGTADPGEKVSVTLASASRIVIADKTGRWRVDMPRMEAGGPHTLLATGRGGASARAGDLLVGDVWLCSGQSNMEYPVRRALNADTDIAAANDPEVRLLTVQKRTNLAPQTKFADPISWSALTPESVAGFSAACYFMARDLRASEKVPIGLIHSSWGGTQIAPWIDLKSAEAFEKENAGLLALYQRDPLEANLRFGTRWQAWWKERAGTEPWRDSSALEWKPKPAIGDWESWGDPPFKAYN